MSSYYSSFGSGLRYRDHMTGLEWKADVYASQLVRPGSRGLPPRIGSFSFIPLEHPERLNIPEHPLSRVYPGMAIRQYAVVVPDRFKVTAPDGKVGVSFYVDNNGSGPSATVTSEMGRCNVAPLGWEGEDAVANPYLEYRTVVENGRAMYWCNARGHGFNGTYGEDSNLDWIDGTPENLRYMYDRDRGQTAQSVAVPVFYGIGTARQSLPADALKGTYSIMLFFPRPEMVETARKLAALSHLLTHEQAYNRYRGSSGYGTTRGGGGTLSIPQGHISKVGARQHEAWEETFSLGGPKPAYEVAHGHLIKQHVIAPPMLPGLWPDAPSALMVCWPVTEAQAEELARPDAPPGRAGFGWST